MSRTLRLWPWKRAPRHQRVELAPGPRNACLHLDTRTVPLLPVYIGQVLQPGAVEPVATWQLWVHPDWPEDGVTFRRGELRTLEVDMIPTTRSTVRLRACVDRVAETITVPRHPG